MAGFHNYFPKLCPPSCGLEINFRRLRNNPRITVLTLAELEKLEGSPGQYEATVKIAPRYVSSACTLCGDCVDVCRSEIADPLEFGLMRTKAVHARRLAAFPATYVLDRAACATDCHACVDACKYGAINLPQGVERKTFRVGSVIVATGWKPYDAAKLDNLGFGKCANVVTNVMLERLAALDGPTGGKLLRPSDGKAPKSVAFVQCAGSRDQNHLPYCSTVCCSASLKQTTYLRKLYPGGEDHDLLHRRQNARTIAGVCLQGARRRRRWNWSKERWPRSKRTRRPRICASPSRTCSAARR